VYTQFEQEQRCTIFKGWVDHPILYYNVDARDWCLMPTICLSNTMANCCWRKGIPLFFELCL